MNKCKAALQIPILFKLNTLNIQWECGREIHLMLCYNIDVRGWDLFALFFVSRFKGPLGLPATNTGRVTARGV